MIGERAAMISTSTRREFLRDLGLGTASLPFLMNLPSLAFANQKQRKQRLVIVYHPNGVVPKTFWPALGDRPAPAGEKLVLTDTLKPLAPFKSKMLLVHGLCGKIQGKGGPHMIGTSSLLTGIELLQGNIQSGGGRLAGWAGGPSIDQEIKHFLQKNPATRTRFGSLEFGVLVPEQADPFTRMVYAAANKPVTPINDPYQMFSKLYGKLKDRELLASVLDGVTSDLKKVSRSVSAEDRRLLEEHATFVRETEQRLRTEKRERELTPPVLEAGVRQLNQNMPRLSKMQIDLLVHSFLSDSARVATLQYTRGFGKVRMRWLGITEEHHKLSHEPDSDTESQEQLTKIDTWFCTQVAYLVKRLAETPEPGGKGSLLDNTQVVWTNELGKGNNHSKENLPFVLVGGGLDFRTDRFVKLPPTAHNRMLLALAHGFGHRIEKFGNPDYCGGGALSLS
jgi:hypothetical protein